jgi:hypothetical protein
LDHEVGDNAVEYEAIEVVAPREPGEVLAGFRGVVVVELDDDGALAMRSEKDGYPVEKHTHERSLKCDFGSHGADCCGNFLEAVLVV